MDTRDLEESPVRRRPLKCSRISDEERGGADGGARGAMKRESATGIHTHLIFFRYSVDGNTTMDHKSIDETEVENVILQEELLELSINELKVTFKRGYQIFWLQAGIPEKYPGLWGIVQKLLIAFPSSYLVEKSFSAVTNLLTKKEQIENHRKGSYAETKWKAGQRAAPRARLGGIEIETGTNIEFECGIEIRIKIMPGIEIKSSVQIRMESRTKIGIKSRTGMKVDSEMVIGIMIENMIG
ncbi:SCAN domain-containing protein 3 [Eumeta japonica]|uniref:SCAN domain-containing protein 3 n=1 Tax=Eumeta variegata TaxID=151549 RepID=A0A4C1VH61_EUMVA|nr:SCAN domain-containing protein 3 [Eumeta japonica]